MVPKSDHLANPRFDKKPSAHSEDETFDVDDDALEQHEYDRERERE